MKKILEKSFTGLIFIFFILFLVLIRLNAEQKPLVYGFGILIAGIFFIILPYLLNNSKKIGLRRFYLLSMTFIGSFIVLEAINFFVFYFSNVDLKTFKTIYNWILNFNQAFFITFAIFTIIYAIKDFFKKDYSFKQLDLQSLTMVLNLLASMAIVILYFNFDAGYVFISRHIDPITLNFLGYDLTFSECKTFINGTIATSIIYIVSYTIIQLITYFKFEKH